MTGFCPKKIKYFFRTIVFLLLVMAVGHQLSAQDLEPRILSEMPTGGNIAVASYGFSSGNILLDNALPIEGLNANMNSVVAAYLRSFSLFSRLAKFDVILPYAFADYEGKVNGIDSTTNRSGIGDPAVRLSVIWAGNKAMNREEFMKAERNTFSFGTQIRLKLPVGQYNPEKLINLGANRWSLKVGFAGSYNILRKVMLEAQVNYWFFSENNDFFGGNSLKQKPLLTTQFHTTYVFNPKLWMSLSLGKSFMGETVLNGENKNDKQTNSRIGFTTAFRLNPKHSLKFGVTNGLITKYGADFTSVLFAYQYTWFRKN